MPENLSPHTQALINSIGREGVIQGSEYCTYHSGFRNWKPIALLPSQLARTQEIGESVLNPKIRAHPEAFSYRPSEFITWLQIAFLAENPNIDVRIFQPPQVKPEELVYREFLPTIRRINAEELYLQKYFRSGKKLPTKIHTGEIHPNPDFEPTNEVPIEPIITDIMLERFSFWRAEEPSKTTGSDPHRFIMTIVGISKEVKDSIRGMIAPLLTDFPKPSSGPHRLVYEGKSWKLVPIPPDHEEV